MSSSLPYILSMTIKGNIHSKFKSSFNIKANDYLIHVNSEEGPLSSYGIKIRRKIFNEIIKNISIGDIVIFRNNIILIYSSFGEVFEIDTGKIGLMDLKIQQIKPTESRLRLILQEIQNFDLKNKTGLPDDELTKKSISYLADADANIDMLKITVKCLVGRGLGLTPSGDDCLFGFIFILKLFCIFEGTLDSFVYQYSIKHTTDISIAYFRLLCSGYISEYYKSFAEAVKEENADKLRRAIKSITTVGYTSGHDGLLGIYLGTERLLDEINLHNL